MDKDLIKRARPIIQTFEVLAAQQRSGQFDYDVHKFLIDLLAALKDREWQPINDKHKDEGRGFLVWEDKYDRGVVIGKQIWDKKWVDDEGFLITGKPTHWMPLPPLPIKEG